MASKLPPLNFQEEIEQYDAKHETKEITFPQCPHKDVRLENGFLKCKCGVGWDGPASQLAEIYRLLTQ